MNQPEEGLALVEEVHELTRTTGNRFLESELHRLKGDLLLSSSPIDEGKAEASLLESLSIAHSREERLWELRSALSLARLWKQQGRKQEAHDLLAPLYEWFTEGLDTRDLQDAKTLLEELA